MAVSRRTFLIRGAEVGLGVAAVGLVGARIIDKRNDQPVLHDKGAFPEPGNPKVAVVKATSYDDGLQATVKSGLESVGADVSGKTVLLKPNLVEFDAGTVINTDPRLVPRQCSRCATWAPHRSPWARARAIAATPSTWSGRRGCSTR